MPPLTAKLHYPTLTASDGTVYHLSSRDGVKVLKDTNLGSPKTLTSAA